MSSIHKVQRLGHNDSGAKAGIEFPRDDLRLEGLLVDGELVERPEVSISHVGAGEWRIKLLDGESRGAD